MRNQANVRRMARSSNAVVISAAAIVVLANAACAAEPVELAEKFVDQLTTSMFDDAVSEFDATMTKAMPAAKLATTWKGVVQAAGEFEKRVSSSTKKVPKYDVVSVTCKFSKLSLDVRVVVDGDGKIAGLFFAPSKTTIKYKNPDYVDTSKFRNTGVVIGRDPWKVSGTLSTPIGKGPLPAVVLVHGSGPGDRDETVGACKPFKDLAGGLASRGIAVLRYDKRTRVHGAAIVKLKKFTAQEETIDDVFAAIETLGKDTRINPEQIFVAGHSFGGYLVPRIASHKHSDRIAGFVLLAGNTRSIEELTEVQTEYILALDGELSNEDKAQLKTIRELVKRIRDPQLGKKDDAEQLLGAPASYWLDLRDYKPHELAKKTLTQPSLILQGERDYQVTMKDFAAWKSTLAAKEHVTFKSYPKLNHLFVTGDKPSVPAEYQAVGHVAPEVIEDVAEWLIGQSEVEPKSESK